MRSDMEILKEIIKNAENIVFFGGAGVSTGSGIPDFRGNGGLYQKETAMEDTPEIILSGFYLKGKPEAFYTYYKKHMVYPKAKPNGAHLALAKLERAGKLLAVITQNIDGLHQLAGNRTVYELHGSVLRNYCTHCGKPYALSYILDADGVPYCTDCGAIVRPDVVLYNEGLDGMVFEEAASAIRDADVLIVGGTSLSVYPAAYLPQEFQGKHLIILNQTPTPYDEMAELVIREPIEKVLSEVVI